MIPRRELTELLQNRLRELLPHEKVEELISAIVELEEGWEEFDLTHRDMGYSVSAVCPDICWLAEQVDRGASFKLYRKKKP